MQVILGFVANFITPTIVLLAMLHAAAMTYFLYHFWQRREQYLTMLEDVLPGVTISVQDNGSKIDQLLIESEKRLEEMNQADRGFAKRVYRLRDADAVTRRKHFDIIYNASRVGAEVYPLLGIMGTIAALAVAAGAEAGAAADVTDQLLGTFKIAIHSTLAGLFFGIVFMVGHSVTDKIQEEQLARRDRVTELLVSAARKVSA